MAAATVGVPTPPDNRVIDAGRYTSVITAAETDQLKTERGKVGSLMVWGDDAGTTCVVNLYDDAASNTRQVFRWVTADGKGVFAVQLPMAHGIRVVVSGTLPTNGGITLVWS